MRERAARWGAVILGAFWLALFSACRQDMFDQPRYEPLEASSLFGDGASARRPPRGTVSREDLRGDTALWGGVDASGAFVSTPPVPVTMDLVRRGEERFGIFCTPCHGFLGDGHGMIVQRGYKAPPSFHTDRLRRQPTGYFVDVMANGFGVMPGYAARIAPEDRWAIAAYIGALQLSQSAPLGELPAKDAESARAAAAKEGR
ncbi:MAG: cytochrome c [Polyangiaceae bacterium]